MYELGIFVLGAGCGAFTVVGLIWWVLRDEHMIKPPF